MPTMSANMKLLNSMIKDKDHTTEHSSDHLFGAGRGKKELPYTTNHNTGGFTQAGGRKQKKDRLVSYFSSPGNLLTPSLRKSDLLKLVPAPQLTAEELQKELKRTEDDEFQDKVKNLHTDVQMSAPEEPFTFPSTEHDFNLQEAVQSSIVNYKRAKNKYNMSGGGVSRLVL